MSEHLDQFMQRAANVLHNVSANFRLLRDRTDPATFQPFCEQVLQLARKVQALRFNDDAIPDERVEQLAGEAANALKGWLDKFGDEPLRPGPQPPPDGPIRTRGRARTPGQALLAAIGDLGRVIDQEAATH